MNYDVKELKDIIQMNQATIKEYLDLHLQDLGYTTVNKKGFLYAEGDIPVLLVAHLDTVHSEKAEVICFSEDPTVSSLKGNFVTVRLENH